MDNILELPNSLKGGKDLDQLLAEKQQENIINIVNSINDVTAGKKAQDVVIACIERVMQVARQAECPAKFRMAIMSMMAGAIRELTGL
jgi:hypothetical protein